MAGHRDKNGLCTAAATGAVMQLAPELNWEEASKITVEAIAAVSARWPERMRNGAESGGTQMAKNIMIA